MVKKRILALALCGVMCAGICTPVSAAELPTDTTTAVEIVAETAEETSEEAVAVEATTEAEETTTEEDVVTAETETVVEDATQTDAALAEDTEEVDAANVFEWNGTVITGYKGTGGAVTIPSTCTGIGESAFYECNTITSVTIPDSVVEMGDFAFKWCDELKTVVIGSGLTKIPDLAFAGCQKLEKVTLNCTKATEIGQSAFSGSLITTITIPDSVKTLGEYVFSRCENLKTVNFGSGLTSIGRACFLADTALESIKIPDSVTEVGGDAFFGCTALKDVRLGNKVARIKYTAFAFCTSLQSIYMPYCKTWIATGNDDILKSTNNVTVYVYSGTSSETWAKENGKNYVVRDFAPNPVLHLKAVTVGKNRVRLSWTEAAYADGYIIYAIKDKKYGYVGMTSNTSFVDVKALGDSYNFYYVYPYSLKEDKQKAVGKCDGYVYAKGICLAVKNLKATGVKGGVKVTFTKSYGADGYYVFKKVGSEKFTYIGYTTGNTYTDKKASKTQYNFYRVVPYHKEGTKKVMGQLGTYVYGKAQ